MQKVKDACIIIGLLIALCYGAAYCVNAIKARNAYEEALIGVIQGGQMRQSAPAQAEENNGNSEER